MFNRNKNHLDSSEESEVRTDKAVEATDGNEKVQSQHIYYEEYKNYEIVVPATFSFSKLLLIVAIIIIFIGTLIFQLQQGVFYLLGYLYKHYFDRLIMIYIIGAVIFFLWSRVKRLGRLYHFLLKLYSVLIAMTTFILLWYDFLEYLIKRNRETVASFMMFLEGYLVITESIWENLRTLASLILLISAPSAIALAPPLLATWITYSTLDRMYFGKRERKKRK